MYVSGIMNKEIVTLYTEKHFNANQPTKQPALQPYTGYHTIHI